MEHQAHEGDVLREENPLWPEALREEFGLVCFGALAV